MDNENKITPEQWHTYNVPGDRSTPEEETVQPSVEEQISSVQDTVRALRESMESAEATAEEDAGEPASETAAAAPEAESLPEELPPAEESASAGRKSKKKKKSSAQAAGMTPPPENGRRKRKIPWYLSLWLIIPVIVLSALTLWFGLEASRLKGQVDLVEEDVHYVLSFALDLNVDAMQYSVLTLDNDMAEARQLMDRFVWRNCRRIPALQDEFSSADNILTALTTASDVIFKPGIDLLHEYPFSTLKSETGINLNTSVTYINFATSIFPTLREVLDTLENEDLEMIDEDGLLRMCVDIASISEDYVENTLNELVIPAVYQLVTCPIETLKTEAGFNVTGILSYLDLLEDLVPKAEKTLDDLEFMKSGSLIPETEETDPAAPALSSDAGAQVVTSAAGSLLESEQLDGYIAKARELLASYHAAEEYIPIVRDVLGSGENKMYAIVAQNSAELRASGGFPGAVGLIQITDGILTIGDFSGVHDYFVQTVTDEMGVTALDLKMFSSWMFLTWDAGYCPDFVHVANIWSYAIEQKIGTRPDGIISVTPAVIHELIKTFGDITLDDGTILNGENTTRIIQHDIYSNNFNWYTDVNVSNAVADAIFSETARKTISLVLSSLTPDNILTAVDLFDYCAQQRMIEIWMKDEQQEQRMIEMGWDGGLNRDPMSPQAGVYFAGHTSCKLGYFVDIFPEMSAPVLNEDGSRTYDITVTVYNRITWDEGANAHWYISGDGGKYGAFFHFFAPAGGSISNFHVDKGVSVAEHTYNDLQDVHFDYYLLPEGSVTVTYQVTTAPGAGDLTFSLTPTLQNYR